MRFDYTLGGPIGTRATLGLVALQSDETVEHDLRRLLPLDGVNLHVTRVPSGLEVSTDTLAEMQATLPAAAALFPRPARFDAVGYGCTSGTAVIGAAKIAELVRSGTVAAQVTEPVSGLIAACKALGLRRLALLSPYVETVSARLRAVLAEAGVETPVFGSFNEAEEAKVARIDTASVIAAARALAAKGGADALFLSCTNLRTLDAIGPIEAETGLPVLSSNLVLGWHMARLGGLDDKGAFGRLWQV